ncbi:MAG TPA: MATE family efflux transporter [Mycobacteriales bacterium]|nr:MATE family efflux transporter [Mycobacteriales bacterium]
MSETRPAGVLSLAVPALGTLAAEPLYVLIDTAVVGHLGAVQLGGLGVAGALMSQVAGQCNFLAYGTTGRAARRYGAGHREEAVGEGVQATWLALGIGVLILIAGQLVAGPAAGLLAGDNDAVRRAAVHWLRIALFGAPFILLSLAGNGWMRGVHEARKPFLFVLIGNGLSAVLCPTLVYGAGMGLAGSAVANVVAQSSTGVLFLRALRTQGVSLRPDPAVMRAQLVVARDLVVRTLGMQICFLSATSVAARMGTAQVAAHQVALQLWTFLSLALDAFAIAAQSLVGAALGSGDERRARSLARTVSWYGAAAGLFFGAVLMAGWSVLPGLFTSDGPVVHQAHIAWPWLAGMQPLAGIVFALDGVLIGAGDVGFLRTLTVAVALLGFLPMTLIAYFAGLGLGGVWAGLTLFIVLRLIGMVWRTAGGRWARIGATA